ncbi:MAG: tetratricopeptide repeat protein [Bacteroidaceae bacterium]|nr:tetratricopeptide repeat protein [Bacteroidaceae bacterium]
MTARFNTLHNGQMAFREGEEAQNVGHKEDYTRLLPMFVSTNKTTASLGRSNFETAITKSEKAIKVHSIKKRPTTSSNKRRTPKQKAYLARKEFNPYLYKAWLLMGEAQFRRGEFIEAASTYNYIMRLYSTQPDVVGIAKARLARCYVALDWAYDAEDILNKMKRDSLTLRGMQERDRTAAAFHLLTQQYDAAIPYLKNTVKRTRGKLPRARMNFLLGQLYQKTGDKDQSYKAFGRVVRSNPPYEMAFNARIMQTEVMSEGKYKQMIARLKRMAKSDKNKDYLDKVYYAIGNIYLSVQDTAACISAYETGVLESKRGGIDKAMLLLRLSQLYWEMENYIEAARTYKDCVAILDKEHEEYEESERRSKILTELEPHLSAIKLQDSLQALAQMDEPERLAAIDRVIEALKKKEKEEEKRAARNALQNNTAAGGRTNAGAQPASPSNRQTTPASGGSSGQKGDWYFYNPATVAQGLQEFQKRWGQRKNEDNWRISNKATLLADAADDSFNYDEINNDSLLGEIVDEEILTDEEKALKDSLENDPHQREYYLKQIPMTEEMMASSHQTLAAGLYNAGILEQENLENFPLAERTMLRLLADYPEQENLDNVYYHLFLLYGRLMRDEEAETYRQKLIEEYPESKYTQLIGNPNYEMIAREGKHVEDSLYQWAYELYQATAYPTVEEIYQYCTTNFPEGRNRARLLFIRAMSQLYSGERDSFLVSLKEVVQKYPKEEISELASSIVKGVEDGRLLSGDRYDANGIWGRRNRRSDADSTEAAPTLSDERYCDFAFVLAYPTDSLDEDQLLFEVARYNFTNYMARNFEIEMYEDQGLSMMVLHGFHAYDEVHAFAQNLYLDEHMARVLEGIRTLLISEDNLKMLGKEFSFDEYKAFYDETFAPLDVPEDLQIDEPENLEIIDPDDEQPEKKEVKEAPPVEDDDDFPFGF